MIKLDSVLYYEYYWPDEGHSNNRHTQYEVNEENKLFGLKLDSNNRYINDQTPDSC